MLKQLSVKNFAIIDDIEITFKEGLTVITGETGAGKSIIADAIDFLLGARVGTDIIKNGTDKAIVEGIFSLVGAAPLSKYLTENGFSEGEEAELFLSRELSPTGSKARINGILANISQLNKLRNYLTEIHKQNEHTELLKTEKQLEILDGYGGESQNNLLDIYKAKYEKFVQVKKSLNEYIENESDINKKINYLEFEINDIKQAQILDINEDKELEKRREVLLNKKELTENTSRIEELINGNTAIDCDQSLMGLLTQIKKLLQKNSHYDESFKIYAENLEDFSICAKELSSFISDYSESLDSNENDLEEIEDRLNLFYKVKKKYGKDLYEVLEYLKNAETELNNLKENGGSKEDLEKNFNLLQKELNSLAKSISENRESFAKTLVDKINNELKALGFNTAIFVIEFIKTELSQSGKEQIQFLFSANPDESPKPLLKVASGGELSRIMLAIKSCTGGNSGRSMPWNAPTVIFDEIDTGISGEIASNVAKKLYQLSRNTQIIAITHQPIIAAMADENLFVQKDTQSGITKTYILQVDDSNKADIIAHLLLPERNEKDISADAKHYASSLIENAKKIKEKDLLNQLV